jgi:hypothetical protein
MDQNASCWAEYGALSSILQTIPKPQKVLEIGPGLGRSVVFFSKILGWVDTEFHLFEGNGKRTRYTILGPRFHDSFCGNIPLLKDVLDFNGVRHYKVFEAEKLDFKLSRLPGTYDIIYSFYAIGFHWSLEHFLDEILALMHENSFAFFTVPHTFIEFKRLKDLRHRVIESSRTASETVKILVLTKKSPFDIGTQETWALL